MSEVNVDAELVKSENTLSRTEEKLVEMSNGCICCTLREDLMVEVERLAKEDRFDSLLIESTGISEPIPVAQTFSFVDDNQNIDLSILKSIIRKLNPSTKIIESTYSKVDLEVILNTGLFDFDQAEQSAGWIAELNKENHTPETEEYGISSFVDRSKNLFNPHRFFGVVYKTDFHLQLFVVKDCFGLLQGQIRP